MPCIITADTGFVIITGPSSKQLLPLATALFSCCRRDGIPDVGLGQHTLANRGQFHRYDVIASAEGKHFYFDPAEINIELQMRSAELGAAWLQSVPPGTLAPASLSENVQVAWELDLNAMPPAHLDFKRPKLWLTRSIFLQPGLHYKI